MAPRVGATQGLPVHYRRMALRYREAAGHRPRPLAAGAAARFPLAAPEWRPPADLYETPTSLEIRVDLPGVPEDRLDVTLYDDGLVIGGERPCPRQAGEVVYHYMEIPYGAFRLEVPVPAEVDPDRIAARYEGGFLQVTLPKRRHA
jgi:HSP20 family molecular chaperone IbpA